MISPRYIPLVVKQVVRHRTRTLLTVLGVAMAMFMFVGVQALQRGVADATEASSRETTLIVYRENRFCPFTSRLPQYYEDRIARIPGVAAVVPMKIVVNNCRASLDVVTFRGIPPDRFDQWSGSVRMLSGSIDKWRKRTDAALMGEAVAARKGLTVGDAFDAAGLTVLVAGVFASDQAQDINAAYVHLPFLQESAQRGGQGIVTQFNVRVDDPTRLEAVAEAIDAEFRHDAEPTHTRAEKAFVAAAAKDIIQIVGFTRYLGWACLAAVLALVANAIVLSVQDRIKEHAVLQTLGFRAGLIGRLIVAEGVLLGVLGGTLGTFAAAALVYFGRFSLSVEGVSMTVHARPAVVLTGLIISIALGIVAGAVPAFQASRRQIAACFRAV